MNKFEFVEVMRVKLGDVCEINPKITPDDLDMNVSFIPMQRVSDQGDIDTSDIRAIKEVCKGFTAFVDGDILMAKITPCMENGKGAIASGLHNGIGYGSTEFHVLRPNQDLVRSSWIYYFTIEKLFRLNCEKNMTGSAGQKRVPKSYLQGYPIPLPSLAEQDMKIATLDRIRQIIILYKSQLQKLDNIVKARFIEQFGDPRNQSRYPTVALGSISNMISGGTPSSKHPEYFGGNIPFVSTPCLGPNFIDDSDAQNWLTELGVQMSSTHIVPANSLMIGNRVGVGKSSINTCDMCTNQDILSFVDINTDKYDLLFIKKVIEQYGPIFENQKRGATIKGVPSDLVKASQIPQAPIDVQKAFVDFVLQSDKSKFAYFL